MTPSENFAFINDYLGAMEPEVSAQHGFIDKYIGDGIMALFDRSPDDALQAGLGMLRALAAFNTRRQAQGRAPIGIGVGINTGRLMLGAVGGVTRMESTVVSDAVNIAARVETLTKAYGAPLLITEDTLHGLSEPLRWGTRLLDRVLVKSKREPVTVHEVFEGDSPSVRAGKGETRPLFEAGVRAFHRGELDLAREMFEQCVARVPDDLPARLYLGRCNPD
jgi:class 3 adenylate cyclase